MADEIAAITAAVKVLLENILGLAVFDIPIESEEWPAAVIKIKTLEPQILMGLGSSTPKVSFQGELVITVYSKATGDKQEMIESLYAMIASGQLPYLSRFV